MRGAKAAHRRLRRCSLSGPVSTRFRPDRIRWMSRSRWPFAASRGISMSKAGPNSVRWFVGLLVIAVLSAFAQEVESATARAFGGIHPALSPDGKVIALSYQGAICRMPGEGGPLTRLTRGEGWDVEPAWAPDGNRIVFINAPGFFTG